MVYDTEFYLKRYQYTQNSAKKIIDIFFKHYSPNSVLDIGCATGIWLSELKQKGVKKVLGVDGSWVPSEKLLINKNEFLTCDLNTNFPKNLNKYDLCICIEVAEHLSHQQGITLIDFLTNQSDVILFSAAIPYQGGTGHINEQPQSYWFRLFMERGFKCYDLIRPDIWEADDVNVIYKQNLLVYVRNGSSFNTKLETCETYIKQSNASYYLDRVHPSLFQLRAKVKVGICEKTRQFINNVLRLNFKIKKG